MNIYGKEPTIKRIVRSLKIHSVMDTSRPLYSLCKLCYGNSKQLSLHVLILWVFNGGSIVPPNNHKKDNSPNLQTLIRKVAKTLLEEYKQEKYNFHTNQSDPSQITPTQTGKYIPMFVHLTQLHARKCSVVERKRIQISIRNQFAAWTFWWHFLYVLSIGHSENR